MRSTVSSWLVGKKRWRTAHLGNKKCTAKCDKGGVTKQSSNKSRAQESAHTRGLNFAHYPTSTPLKAWEHSRNGKDHFPSNIGLEERATTTVKNA